jgi:hypothetical protein
VDRLYHDEEGTRRMAASFPRCVLETTLLARVVSVFLFPYLAEKVEYLDKDFYTSENDSG